MEEHRYPAPSLPSWPIDSGLAEPADDDPRCAEARREDRRRAGRIFLLSLVFAVVGGVAASLLYDGVAVPSSGGIPLGPTEAWAARDPVAGQESRVRPVLQALAAARLALGPDAIADVTADRDQDVVFLLGRTDSRRTLALLQDAVGALSDVRAVDTRGVYLVDREHVVAPGDNLWKLARRYYGYSAAWKVLADANPQLEKRGLRAGDVLRVAPLDR